MFIVSASNRRVFRLGRLDGEISETRRTREESRAVGDEEFLLGGSVRGESRGEVHAPDPQEGHAQPPGRGLVHRLRRLVLVLLLEVQVVHLLGFDQDGAPARHGERGRGVQQVVALGKGHVVEEVLLHIARGVGTGVCSRRAEARGKTRGGGKGPVGARARRAREYVTPRVAARYGPLVPPVVVLDAHTSSSERVGTPPPNRENAPPGSASFLTGIVANRESTNRLKTRHAALLENLKSGRSARGTLERARRTRRRPPVRDRRHGG